MTEPKVLALGKQGNTHQMLFLGQIVDTMTGEEWELFDCPICGYSYKVQWEPYKSVTLKLGEGMLTEEDVDELRILVKTPAGRAKAEKWLSGLPTHAYVRVPTEDELREMARNVGKLPEFEASVDQAIIDGKPLIGFGMGGATAETWPRGTKPR